MQSEIDLLKQRITELEARNVELETENAEIPELRKKLAEIPELRKKLAEVEARNVEIEARNAEFNSGAVHHEKPLEEKEMDSFLLEAHKKIVSSEIKQRNKEKKFLRKSANQDVTFGNAYVSETVVVAPQLVIADTPQEEIPTVDSKVTHDIKAVNRYPENSYEDAHRMSLEISEEFEKTVPSGNDQSHVTSVKPDLAFSAFG